LVWDLNLKRLRNGATKNLSMLTSSSRNGHLTDRKPATANGSSNFFVSYYDVPVVSSLPPTTTNRLVLSSSMQKHQRRRVEDKKQDSTDRVEDKKQELAYPKLLLTVDPPCCDPEYEKSLPYLLVVVVER
jgi:hypothetical protein